MKKTLVVLAVIVIIGLIPYLMAQPGEEPITSSNVFPIMLLQGDRITGGAIETDPNFVTEFVVISAPPEFTYDVNEVNLFQFVYNANTIGVETIYIEATVISPYRGRPVVWALQIDTRSDLSPKLEWFYSVLQ